MPATARLAKTIQCPECCYDVKPYLLKFNAGIDPHAVVECPRPQCGHVWHVYPSDDNGD